MLSCQDSPSLSTLWERHYPHGQISGENTTTPDRKPPPPPGGGVGKEKRKIFFTKVQRFLQLVAKKKELLIQSC